MITVQEERVPAEEYIGFLKEQTWVPGIPEILLWND